MDRKKEAPSTKGAPGVMIGNHHDQHQNDNTTDQLMSILLAYRNGASREMLSYMLGISDRTLRAEVAKARRLGHPICSNSEVKGYRIGSKADTARTIAELRARARELTLTADAMEEKLIEQEEGQQIALDLI